MAGTLDGDADSGDRPAAARGVATRPDGGWILGLGSIKRESSMAWSGRLSLTPPTLADVAERAGVSRQTVSNAVNNPELLRPDTLARVQDAIAELGYSPNRAARNLRTRASHLIGLKFNPAQEGTANAAMDRFVHTPRRHGAVTAGYHVLLFAGRRRRPGRRVRRPPPLDRGRRLHRHRHLPRQPAGGLADPAARAVRGVRPAVGQPRGDPPLGRRRRRRRFRARHRPPARQGPHPDGLDRLAQGLLHRRGPPSGWTRAMHARDLPTTGLASRVEDTVSSGREAASVLLDEAQPSAFVCASDTLAMGVLHALGDRGIHWGKDVAVVGFDDSQVAQVVPGGLTSVRQPLEQVAVEVVKALEGTSLHAPRHRPGVSCSGADARRPRLRLPG